MASDVAARVHPRGGLSPRRAVSGSPRRASQTASWPAIAAWGAGLVLAGLGAAALTGGDLTPAISRVLGIPLVLLGLGTIVWGTAALSRGGTPFPRAVVTGALVGVVAAAASFAADPVGTSVVAVATASALFIALAMLVAVRLRRPAHAGRTGVAGIILAACVVSAVAGPALAAAGDARLTQGNGGVPVVVPEHHSTG